MSELMVFDRIYGRMQASDGASPPASERPGLLQRCSGLCEGSGVGPLCNSSCLPSVGQGMCHLSAAGASPAAEGRDFILNHSGVHHLFGSGMASVRRRIGPPKFQRSAHPCSFGPRCLGSLHEGWHEALRRGAGPPTIMCTCCTVAHRTIWRKHLL